MLRRLLLSAVSGLLTVISFTQLSGAAEAETNWPRFLGPAGDAHSSEVDLPVKWTADDVTWQTELGGVGQSSPVVWEDRIYLTTAEKTADGGAARYVLCISRDDGKQLWRTLAATGPGEELHKMNSWATPSCVTDGERVAAYFGPGGLHCFDMQGERLWSLDLIDPAGPWGFAGSPVILDNMVIQNCDSFGKSFLVAVDKTDGKEIWRTDRRDKPRGGWSTPLLIDTGDRKELVLNGEFGVQSYDPATGEPLWFCQSFNGRGTPVPAFTHGLLVTVNGKPGDIYAVRPGGSGDVTKTHMAWHTKRSGGRDLPSPVAVGDYVFVVNMTGIATLYDAAGGKELWKSRLGGNYSATPFIADGLIYALSEEGETVVIRPGDKLDIVSRNSLGPTDGEIFRASPTPSAGRVFCRSDRTLYCVGNGAE